MLDRMNKLSVGKLLHDDPTMREWIWLGVINSIMVIWSSLSGQSPLVLCLDVPLLLFQSWGLVYGVVMK
jgi:hypothetical protein